MSDGVHTVSEGTYVVGYLFVEQSSVCHNYSRVKELHVESLGASCFHRAWAHLYYFVCEPCERVRLARACRVHYQVSLAHSVCLHVVDEPCHHVELVIAREDEPLGVFHDVRHFLARLCLAVVHQCVVGDDVGDSVAP